MKPLIQSLILLCACCVLAVQGPRPAQAQQPAKKKLRIVFFGAHCDDNETGAGGLMATLAKAGHEVISAYGTTYRGNRKINDEPEDIVRRRESTAACKILGATPKFFDYAHENLWADPPTLKTVSAWFEQVEPDIVVAHWPLDSHPNHHVVSSLTWLCYKPKGGWNLYFYEVLTDEQSLGFRAELYLDIEPVRDIKKKAIECIKSQSDWNLWQSHEKMHCRRGAECGVEHAEAYFLVEAKPDCPLLPVQFLPKKN